MNIKNIYKSILCASAALCFSCCSLDEYDPGGVVPPDEVFSTREGYQGLINSMYYDLKKFVYGLEDFPYLTESGTDLWINAASNPTYGQEFSKYENMISTKGQLKKLWSSLYQIVNQANAAIERVDKVPFSSPEERRAVVGEAYFMRGFAYFHIVEQFGGVVLKTDETKVASSVAYRTPVAEFYELILSDLQKAAQYLPLTQTDYGRPTQKAALGLLAKAALQRTAYGDVEVYAKIARDAAKDLIDHKDSYNAYLYPTFTQVFDDANYRTNREALWVIANADFDNANYNPNGWTPNKLFQFWLPSLGGGNTAQWGVLDKSLLYGRANQCRFMPTRYLLTVFSDEDLRYEGSFREQWFCETEKNVGQTTLDAEDKTIAPFTIHAGDVALFTSRKPVAGQQTLPYKVSDIGRIYNPDGSVSSDERFNRYYPGLKKFDSPRARTFNGVLQHSNSYADIFVMRFAEAYLIAAEAEILLGSAGNAAGYINTLRERACDPVDFIPGKMQVDAAAITSNEGRGGNTVDFILDERARELCGELTRWYDLKRTKSFERRLGAGKQNPDITKFDPSKHYLRPVPEDALKALTNWREFGQNPGF